MNQHKTKAFTLVELLIVIVILSILSTIWFVSISGYIKNSKFTSNDVTLRNIESWILNHYTKVWYLPLPDGDISTWTFSVWGSTLDVLYSWFIWENITRFSWMYWVPKNALNNESFYYGVSANKKNFQIWVLQPQLISWITTNTFANNEIIKISWNYTYPLVLWNSIINIPSLLLESNSWSNLTNNSYFFIDNQSKWTSADNALKKITSQTGISLTWIVLQDWQTQSWVISQAVWLTQEEAWIRVFWSTKYFNDIIWWKSQLWNSVVLPPLTQTPIFTSSTPIWETQTINGSKVVFAWTQSWTLYMTHPSCGNIAGTWAFIHNCSWSWCMSSLFTQAKNWDYSWWNLSCDGSMGDIYMRWKWSAPVWEFNCWWDDVVCNSPTNWFQNTLEMVSAFSSYNVFNTPANFCRNLRIGWYDDWYLPSRWEMLLLYQNKNLIWNFYPQTYLTSTEYAWNTSYFHFVSMNNWSSTYTFKYTNFWMRCIRKVNN
jgi:prepilin-type N-terminal cleavage/methylation domain-containing protein